MSRIFEYGYTDPRTKCKRKTRIGNVEWLVHIFFLVQSIAKGFDNAYYLRLVGRDFGIEFLNGVSNCFVSFMS